MNILVCFGTRPEAVKMAPVIHELKRTGLSFKICVTAQHREMLDQVLDFFQIIPHYDLDLMRPGQSLNNFSGRLLLSMEEVLRNEQPTLILVHGDTTTSFITALAAFNNGIKIGHIEAGLRTYEKQAPFPEEANRQLTARICSFHFVPTRKAFENLLSEHVPEREIHITGNTIVDALIWAKRHISESNETDEVKVLRDLLDTSRKLIVVTGHRRENFGENMKKLTVALEELVNKNDVQIIFPVHLNPEVQAAVSRLEKKPFIHLINPVSYPTMLWLIQKCDLIISDSGGIQEEAPSFGKKVLVTRDHTERPEGIESGFSILVGCDTEKMIKEATKILEAPEIIKEAKNPYGEGDAAQRIVSILQKELRSENDKKNTCSC